MDCCKQRVTAMGDSSRAVDELRNACHLFADLPERYLIELEIEGSLRTYRLDAGDSVTIRKRPEVAESIMVLGGHVAIRCDDEPTAKDSTEALDCHPIPLSQATTEVTASSSAKVCRFARDKLDYIIGWTVMLNELPAEQDEIRAQLRRLRYPAIFMNLPFANVSKAFQRMERRPVKAGDEIIRQGETGDLFFIIESGRAEVWQQDVYDDEQRLVGVRFPGDHVGDEALVSGGTRNATVRMIEDGAVLTLGQDDFKELISEPMVNEVEIPVAKTLAAEGYQFVDVRYEEEWEDGHIPGARLLPLTNIRERLDELDRHGRFITYCLSGKRSAVAAMLLKARGFDVVCMKDGLRDWPDKTVAD